MKDVIKKLKRAKRVALFSHSNPDPDTIGSTIALFLALKQLGKEVKLYCDAEQNSNYNFLDGYEEYNRFEPDGEFDVYVSVDVASSELLGKFEETFLSFGETIRIDHHISGKDFAKCSVVENVSACAVLIFEILKKMKVKIDSEIATALYLGICGDTGIFRNTNTDSKTFEVCSSLLKCGANFKKVYTEFFDKRSVPVVKLTSNALLEAEIYDDAGFVLMSVSKKDYEKFGVRDSENIGNLPHTYLNCGYKIAAILKEKDDEIKVSIRSKAEYDVASIAEKFGGGGHKNASGCSIQGTLDEAKEKIKNELQNYLGGKNNVIRY